MSKKLLKKEVWTSIVEPNGCNRCKGAAGTVLCESWGA